MKKQLKTTVMAIALLATVTGAFASDIVNAFSGKKATNVNWQRISETTGLPIGAVVPGDASNPFPEDCTGEISQVCAQGTLQGQSTPSLFYYYN